MVKVSEVSKVRIREERRQVILRRIEAHGMFYGAGNVPIPPELVPKLLEGIGTVCSLGDDHCLIIWPQWLHGIWIRCDDLEPSDEQPKAKKYGEGKYQVIYRGHCLGLITGAKKRYLAELSGARNVDDREYFDTKRSAVNWISRSAVLYGVLVDDP